VCSQPHRLTEPPPLHRMVTTLRPATRSRNVYQKLAHASVNLVQFFSGTGTSFLHAVERSPVPAQKLSGTWYEVCNMIGRRVVLVQGTVMNLYRIFHPSFWYKFLERVSPALRLLELLTRSAHWRCRRNTLYKLILLTYLLTYRSDTHQDGMVLRALSKTDRAPSRSVLETLNAT